MNVSLGRVDHSDCFANYTQFTLGLVWFSKIKYSIYLPVVEGDVIYALVIRLWMRRIIRGREVGEDEVIKSWRCWKTSTFAKLDFIHLCTLVNEEEGEKKKSGRTRIIITKTNRRTEHIFNGSETIILVNF